MIWSKWMHAVRLENVYSFQLSRPCLNIKCLEMLIYHTLKLMIWVCHMQHHVARQISQFAESIHNSSPISLASLCRLLCYPTEDRCGSKALWDPDGTFPTIRFGLPLENHPFPARDTNVSPSARNEMTPPNENLRHNVFLAASSVFFFFFFHKANISPLLPVIHATNCVYLKASFKEHDERCGEGKRRIKTQLMRSLYTICHLPKH